jgi:hypothetical protein
MEMGAHALKYAKSRFSYEAVARAWSIILRNHFSQETLT